jgi:hypothetical protein
MTADGRRRGRSHEGVPKNDPVIEVTVRLFPATSAAGADDPRPKGWPFGGATVEWSYPDHLHERALTRAAVVRHAISVLLDELEGLTTVDTQ